MNENVKNETKSRALKIVVSAIIVFILVIFLLISCNADQETPANSNTNAESTANNSDIAVAESSTTAETSIEDDPSSETKNSTEQNISTEETSASATESESAVESSPVDETFEENSEESTETPSSSDVSTESPTMAKPTDSSGSAEISTEESAARETTTESTTEPSTTTTTTTEAPTTEESTTEVSSTEESTTSESMNETTAPAVTLSSITVVARASEYEDGYKLTKSDLTVTVKYSDKSSKTVTDYTISQTGTKLYVTFEDVKSNTITITYKEKETQAPVVTLSSVTVAARASEYEDGYKLTKSDLTVTAKYSDKSSKTVTDYTISQTGTKLYVTFEGVKSNTITITYKEKETQAPVVTLSSVTVAAKASEYEDGYKLTKSDLTVTAKYSDNTSKAVADYTISQTGTKLYVTFEGVKSNTITITYKEKETQAPVVTLSSVTVAAKADGYPYGYELLAQDLIVTAKYSDGSSEEITDGFTITQNGISGYVTLYVTYKGIKSNEISYTFANPAVTAVAISAKASEYEAGYQLTSDDLNVTATYEDGSTKSIEGQYLYIIYQNGASLYINYKGLDSNTITITYKAIAPTVTGVTAVSKADWYYVDTVISANDFVVTASYSDGSSKIVTEDVKLIWDSIEVPSITLSEYSPNNPNLVMMHGYAPQLSYNGILSEAVVLTLRYKEGVWLCPEMLTYVNGARAEAGLSSLTWDTEAEEEILIRAQELVTSFSHSRPNGAFIEDLYPDCMGENIAKGGYRSGLSIQRTYESWMNSPGHKACILDSLIIDGTEMITKFICAYCIATDGNGDQISYWVMWTIWN